MALYLRFVQTVVAPFVQATGETCMYYSKVPLLRTHFPLPVPDATDLHNATVLAERIEKVANETKTNQNGEKKGPRIKRTGQNDPTKKSKRRGCKQPGVSTQRHTDGRYGHPTSEFNIWLPLSQKVWGNNSLFRDATPWSGAESATSFELKYGEFVIFYGNQTPHETKPNDTNITRCSLDLRVIPGSLYEPNYRQKTYSKDGTYFEKLIFNEIKKEEKCDSGAVATTDSLFDLPLDLRQQIRQFLPNGVSVFRQLSKTIESTVACYNIRADVSHSKMSFSFISSHVSKFYDKLAIFLQQKCNKNTTSLIKKIEILTKSGGGGKWTREFSENGGLKRFISILQDSTILKELSMSGFQFSDLDQISKMVHLSTLNLKNNHFRNGKYTLKRRMEQFGRTYRNTDYIPPRLKSAAQISAEDPDTIELQMLQPISNLVQLTALDLSYNRLDNIYALVTLTNLTRLDLYNNQALCCSITATGGYWNRGWGEISDIVSCLEPLREHRKMTELNLGNNQIRDISPLSSLVKITTLNLSKNILTDIAPLSQLTSITTLTLRKNRVVDITVLSNLIQLTDLDLSNNKIVSLDALENLNQLVTFDASRNRIKNIDALHSLTQLQVCSKIEK